MRVCGHIEKVRRISLNCMRVSKATMFKSDNMEEVDVVVGASTTAACRVCWHG